MKFANFMISISAIPGLGPASAPAAAPRITHPGHLRQGTAGRA